MLLIDYYKLWFKTYKEGTVAPATKDTYAATHKHLCKLLSNVRMKDVTRPILQQYFNVLGMSKESARKDLTHLRSMLNDALADDVISRNPAASRINLPSNGNVKSDEHKFMPLADYRKLRAFFNDESLDIMHVNWFIISVIAQTALRVGETIALKEDDIDFEHLTLRGDESYDSMRRTLKPTKTTNANRTIPISADLAKVLRHWIMYHREELFKRGISNPDRLLMLNHRGELPRAVNINKSYRQIQLKLGIETSFSTHTLRHTLASILIADNKVSISYISKFLGHSSELVTRRYYIGLIPDKVQEEQEKTVQVIANL